MCTNDTFPRDQLRKIHNTAAFFHYLAQGLPVNVDDLDYASYFIHWKSHNLQDPANLPKS